jgi:tetratricopeptide (TPR) repeat protein
MILPATVCSILLLAASAVAEPPTQAGPPQDPDLTLTNASPYAIRTTDGAGTTTPGVSSTNDLGIEATASPTNNVTSDVASPPEMQPAETGPDVEQTPEPAEPPPPPITKEDLIEAARESLAPAVDAVSTRLDALEHTLAARYRDTMSNRLDALEQTLLAQHRDSVAATKDTTRTILLVAGCFSTAVLLGVLMGALILARAVQRVSEVVVGALPASRQLTGAHALVPTSETDDIAPAQQGPVEEVTHRFLGAIEKLEQRILELEHTSHADSAAETQQADGNGDHPTGGGGNGGPLEFSVSALSQKQYGDPTGASDQGQPDPHDHAALWIGKGQALLNLGNVEDALTCFESALDAGPRHAADAYVKRGLALERLEKMDDALQSYDQAIAADESMTLAYLYKGAVCNRLQRYREALDCYENALRCEQKLAEH